MILELPKNIGEQESVFPRLAFVTRKICEFYKGGELLDIGCGNGKNTAVLGALGCPILGIDIDQSEITRALDSPHAQHVRFACVSLDDLHETSFAGVLLIEVLEHLPTPLTFLQRAYNLCENEGFVIVTVPNGYSCKERLMAVIQALKKINQCARLIAWYRQKIGRAQEFNESPHVQRFTLPRLRALLEQAGFQIAEEFYSDVWSGFLWMYVPWLPLPLWLKKFECRLSTHLPPALLGDWGVLCVKKDLATAHVARP